MPDTPGAEEFDVNTDEGFNRALAAKVGADITPEQVEILQHGDRSVARGLEIPESSQQARDAEGRFAPAAPAAPAEPAAPVAPATPVEGAAPKGEAATDPLAALLAQHGGDANAALTALLQERENLQGVLGRQGEELGELRKLPERMAHIEGQLEAVSSAPVAPSQFVPVAQLHEAIGQAEDPSVAGPQVMGWIVENAPDQIDATLKVWAEYDAVGAADFAAARRFYTLVEEAGLTPGEGETPPTPKPDPNAEFVSQLRSEREFASAIEHARQGIPDEEWEKLKPVVLQEYDKSPDFIKRAIAESPQDRAEALKGVVATAQTRLVREATEAAKTEQAAAAAAGKQAAQVVTGNLRPVGEAKPEGEQQRTPEEVSKALREALMATETTSVKDGLTYGKQPAPQTAVS